MRYIVYVHGEVFLTDFDNGHVIEGLRNTATFEVQRLASWLSRDELEANPQKHLVGVPFLAHFKLDRAVIVDTDCG